MAPQVKKAKTAFLFYQGDQLAAVKQELGGSMGEAMQEVSCTQRRTRVGLMVNKCVCVCVCDSSLVFLVGSIRLYLTFFLSLLSL